MSSDSDVLLNVFSVDHMSKEDKLFLCDLHRDLQISNKFVDYDSQNTIGVKSKQVCTKTQRVKESSTNRLKKLK